MPVHAAEQCKWAASEAEGGINNKYQRLTGVARSSTLQYVQYRLIESPTSRTPIWHETLRGILLPICTPRISTPVCRHRAQLSAHLEQWMEVA